MKATEIKYNEIVNYLVTVFADDAQAAAYYAGNNPQYILIGGWARDVINTPANRAAFLDTFGEAQTTQAEQEARDILTDRARAFESSQYFAHTVAADEHKAAGQPAPVIGSFVWALSTGLKCEGGAPDALRALYWQDSQKEETPARLVRIDAVFNCTSAEMTAANYAPALVAENMPFPGGGTSDDFDEIDFYNSEQMATVYTIGAAVVDPSGRWYIINSEGYDYSRYILLPLAARDIFADLYTFAKERDEKRKQEEREQAEREKAAALAEYSAKCAKWSPYMENITPYFEKLRGLDWWNDRTEYKAVKRALAACRRRNVLAMARAAFPGVKFSAKKAHSYNGAYLVEWTDGPTEAEFCAATNYEIFASSWQEFNGWNDQTEIVTADFTEFSELYFRDNGVIEYARNISEEKAAETLATLAALVPGVNWQNWGRDTETACKIYSAIYNAGLMPSGDAHRSISRADNPAAILRAYQGAISYYNGTPQEAQKPAQKAARVESGAIDHTNKETATASKETATDAPHDSLSLAEMPGGVYVQGSTRATYCNRKAIKQHGGTWNKTAGRWEATTPAAVATLRAWFALQISA